MKEQVWFKARVISSHGRHSFVEKEDGTVLEATRKGKKVDLAVGDIVDCLQTSAEQVSIQKSNSGAPCSIAVMNLEPNRLLPISIRSRLSLRHGLLTTRISFGRPCWQRKPRTFIF